MDFVHNPYRCGPLRVDKYGIRCMYMYPCLRTLHQFHVLLEISVALMPCILAAMPSNNL